jgi:hypothetical protein
MIQIVGSKSKSILWTSFFSSSGVHVNPFELRSWISTVSLCSFSFAMDMIEEVAKSRTESSPKHMDEGLIWVQWQIAIDD